MYCIALHCITFIRARSRSYVSSCFGHKSHHYHLVHAVTKFLICRSTVLPCHAAPSPLWPSLSIERSCVTKWQWWLLCPKQEDTYERERARMIVMQCNTFTFNRSIHSLTLKYIYLRLALSLFFFLHAFNSLFGQWCLQVMLTRCNLNVVVTVA